MAVFAYHRTLLPLLTLAGIGIGVGSVATPARAQVQADQHIDFDIPMQSLDSALAQYFRITGVQLLYDSSLTAGRRSSAVRGSYAPREALRLLLVGTGLLARYSRASAATIVAVGTDPLAPQIPLGRVVVRERIVAVKLSALERLAYYGRLEEELQAHLRADERTGHLAFRIVVRLSVGEGGRIAGVRVDRGSGKRETDRIVTGALDGVVVSRPPAGLAQPLSIALTGRREP